MILVDSHAHLDDPAFDGEVGPILARARAHGVTSVLTVGCLGSSPGTEAKVLDILDRHSGVLAAFGVHPHDAKWLDDALENRLESLMGHPRVVALGEIGLDFFYDNSPRDVQQEAFRRQIEMARRFRKPIIVHSRDAEEATADILSVSYGDKAEASAAGVLHCFSGSTAFAFQGIQWGFYLSFGGVITFKKAEATRAVLRQIPFDRVLLETDAPYLAPVPFRGKRNEPAHVALVAHEVAQILGRPENEVGQTTSRNFARLFGEPSSVLTE